MLLRAIIEGFSGPAKPREASNTDAPKAGGGSGFESGQVSDTDLAKLSFQAGGSLPVKRGRDDGLPKTPPVFDLEEMRRKNRERIALRHIEQMEKANGR